MPYQIHNKRKLLHATKAEILKDIEYFEKRIEDARSQKTNSSYFDDDDDSDSDIFFLDMGPSVSDLKLEQGRLQTCLNATQELTNLYVLQSEDNVLVNDPVYEKEPPVTEQGIWREVTADCRVDLVPFSITFYVHQASRIFGPTSYRGLRVLPVKTAHENELAKSILPCVDNPGDAVEVLRSYSVAHRSRRTTLARLAEKYPNSLFMEPMAEGGYVIKCANLLEVSWTLENKWSPIAAFHHRMKFDLEYMDEAYVKIISQAHRELSDPTLETDERTRLMSKIIATCLEAQGPTQELYESMESDIESENLRKRRTTLDEEIEEPTNKKKKDSEIMAPPKSLPKKPKAKGKENNANNKKDTKGVKRSVNENDDNVAKKAKLSQENLVENSNVNAKTKVGKEVTVLKKITENKSNIRDNVNKKNVGKEAMKSISEHENRVSNTNNCNKDNVAKRIDANSKHHAVISNKASNNKAGNVKNSVVADLGSVKKTDCNIKNSDKSKDVKESGTSKNKVDKLNLKGKTINEKKKSHTENTNKVVNVKKSNKMPDNIPNKDTEQDMNVLNSNQNPKLDKVSKNVEETITNDRNVESSSQNNYEKTRKTKVSDGQTNVANKDDNMKTTAEVSEKKNKLKAKSTDNVKKSMTNKYDDLNIDKNTNKKKVVRSQSLDRSNTANTVESNSGTMYAKNNPVLKKKSKDPVNRDDTSVKKSGKNRGIKSKPSLNDNVTKNKPSKTNQKDVFKGNIQKNSDQLVKHVPKENPTKSALSNKNAKSNLDKGKTTNKPESAFKNLKPGDTQLKIVVQNLNAKSKNTDKVNEKIDKNNIVTEKYNVTLKKTLNKNDVVNKKFPTDVKEINSNQNNENANRNLLIQKKSAVEQFLVTNDNRKNNPENIKRNVVSNKNQSKSPIQINKINILNPRNKISIDKHKVTNKTHKDTQKDNHDNKKLHTKIPQKLMSIREQIIKKNPLRISPRKIHSNMKTDSQNSSRSSQRSLQKPMTGIPRLMKKPIPKG